MLDYSPPDSTSQIIRVCARTLAIRFITVSGDVLARVAARIGGDDAAALAHALRDMILDPTVDPCHWPISETLALLRRRDPPPDGQTRELIEDLVGIRDTVDACEA